METRLSLLAALILAAFTIGLAGAGDAPKPTPTAGRVSIYNIADLTTGTRESVDQIGKMIQSTVSPDAWGKTAIMRIMPGQITVRYLDKCPADMPGAVDAMMNQWRETRSMCLRIEYRIVVSDKLHGEQFTAAELATLDHARELVSRSQIVVQNGQPATLINGERDINLPTVTVTPIISADHKDITLTIRNGPPDARAGEVTSCSIANGQCAAISINDPAAHQWLVFTATACKLQTVDLTPSPKPHEN